MKLRWLVFVALLAITGFGGACEGASIGGLDDAFTAGDGGVDFFDRTNSGPSRRPDETWGLGEPPPPGDSGEPPPPGDSDEPPPPGDSGEPPPPGDSGELPPPGDSGEPPPPGDSGEPPPPGDSGEPPPPGDSGEPPPPGDSGEPPPPGDSGEPPPPGDSDEPPPPGDSDELPPTPEAYVGTAFFDDFDGTQIDDSVWQVATWTEHGGRTGTERCYVEDGNLKMIFINDSAEGYLSSAIQSREEFYYGRWEARLKPSNVPGVLNSMFTIDWDNTADGSSSSDGTKQEIDIEFLTYSFTGNDGRVHFALHASGLPSADTRPDILLGFDPSADFHVWGFDVTPEKIEWFVDGQVLWTYDYGANPITVDAPYMLKFNVWSDSGWINGPPAVDTESVYLIDWVRFTPYGT